MTSGSLSSFSLCEFWGRADLFLLHFGVNHGASFFFGFIDVAFSDGSELLWFYDGAQRKLFGVIRGKVVQNWETRFVSNAVQVLGRRQSLQYMCPICAQIGVFSEFVGTLGTFNSRLASPEVSARAARPLFLCLDPDFWVLVLCGQNHPLEQPVKNKSSFLIVCV